MCKYLFAVLFYSTFYKTCKKKYIFLLFPCLSYPKAVIPLDIRAYFRYL